MNHRQGMIQILVFKFWTQFSWEKESMATGFRITWDILSNVDSESLGKDCISISEGQAQ